MRITANQVTMARIFLLPLPVYLLIYGETVEWWIAFAIFVLLGATDFVDGLMARIEGPTRFGSLIDPVADKIFVAALVLSMVAVGFLKPWLISALLSREFLMTALRSSVAIRKESFKTSRLAKLKTIIQMGGLGTIFFTIALPQGTLMWLCLGLSLPFLLLALVYIFRSKTAPFWALPVFFSFVGVALTEIFFSKEVIVMIQVVLILGITWASAIDYFFSSYRLFKRTGMMMGDWLRLFWVIVYSLLLPSLVAYFPFMVIPILVSISLEFGLGGIDNMVVAEKEQFSLWPFLLSSLVGFSLWALINALSYWQFLSLPFYCSLVLAAASTLICGLYFTRHIDLFKKALS